MYWKNSNFQILNFIVGKCFTADEAYRVLNELKVDRQLAIEEFQAFELETTFAIQNLESTLNSGPVEAAKLIRLKSSYAHSQKCYEQAVREMEFIDEAIAKVDVHRKYKDLPDHEAHQMIQSDEWKFKLENRARLSLMSTGTVSPELLETISCHPESSQIISTITHLIENPKTLTHLVSPLVPLLKSE